MNKVICTVCPKGCHLTVDLENKVVTGNICPRGAEYGINELTNPVRTVTSTVKINGTFCRRCPVRTVRDVPMTIIPDIMKMLDNVELEAPVKLGDVIAKNVFGSGVDIIITKSFEKTN